MTTIAPRLNGTRRQRLCAGMLTAGLLAGLAGCGPQEKRVYTQLRLVEQEVCETVGTQPEGCRPDEVVATRAVVLREDAPDRVWLTGWPRSGGGDTWLGTRDSRGGLLFVATTRREQQDTGCTYEETTTLSLAGEEGADPFTTDCPVLLGRSVRTARSTGGCTTHGEPVVRVIRGRFEAHDGCDLD